MEPAWQLSSGGDDNNMYSYQVEADVTSMYIYPVQHFIYLVWRDQTSM